jgi:hypothetical protein
MIPETLDPCGYYAALGLSSDASPDAVKAAYRARVKAVHPDRTGSAESGEFHRIAEAYAVLHDVVRRAEYDSTGASGGESDDGDPIPPLTCCRCGQVSAQPRYLVFHRVRSYLVWARTSRLEGIFCRDCADHAAAEASTSTWAWGWWSPFGLLLAPLALLRNLLGGTKPNQVNARILIRQARAFLGRGDLDLAFGVADQARRYARDPAQRRQVDDILRATASSGRRLKDRWRPWSGGAFLPQLLPLAALPLTVAVFVVVMMKPWDGHIGASAGIAVVPPNVGEIRHVAVDALKVRLAPIEGAPVLTLLDRFAAVTTLAVVDDGLWVRVRTPSGVSGYVPTRSLYGGSGEALRHEWCGEHRGAPLVAGEVLMRRATGQHQLLVHNDGRSDAVVKLKTPSGTTVMAYYVPATYHIGVGDIPDGTYRIEFATGSRYSRACGLFVDDMKTAELPVALTLHHVSTMMVSAMPSSMPTVSLIAPSDDVKAPHPIPEDQFLSDD